MTSKTEDLFKCNDESALYCRHASSTFHPSSEGWEEAPLPPSLSFCFLSLLHGDDNPKKFHVIQA